MPIPETLTPDDQALLRATQKRLLELIPEIDKAEACGEDCTNFRRTLEEIRSQLTKIQENFG